MHPLSIPDAILQRVLRRSGRPHPFETIVGQRTALIVIDMQNFFLAPGFAAETPAARDIVPEVNRLASAVRAYHGHVVWISNSTTGTWDDWSVLNQELWQPEASTRRYTTMDETHEGYALWHALDTKENDAYITKKRFSAFIQGSSGLEQHLRDRDVDTVLIAGTATNVCCESTARDAMMLNFRTIMVHDALAAQTDYEHSAALANFYSIFGDVQSVDDVITSLERHTVI